MLGFFVAPREVQAGNATARPGQVIGVLVGPVYRVRIHAALPESLYTIRSQDGTVIAEGLTRDEVALQFPSIPLLAGADGSDGIELWGEATLGNAGLDYVDGP